MGNDVLNLKVCANAVEIAKSYGCVASEFSAASW